MWNLLSIVREMYRRNDRNSIPLLEIVTQQCLETNQIMVWWFNTKVAALQQRNHGGGGGAGGSGGGGGGKHNVSSNSQASQNACASLCDEIVSLWKLAALNPCISPAERVTLRKKLVEYHQTVIEKVQANQGGATGSVVKPMNPRTGRPNDLELFSGFKPAIEACGLGWQDYPIDGVTFGQNSHYLCPFFKPRDGVAEGEGGSGGGLELQHASQVNCSEAVLRCEYPGGRPRPNSGNSNLVQDPQQPPAEEEDESANAARTIKRRESTESFDSLNRRTDESNNVFEAPGGGGRPSLEQQSSEEVVSDEGVAGVKAGNVSARGAASSSGNESSSGQDPDSAQEDSREKTDEPPRAEVARDAAQPPPPSASSAVGEGQDDQYRVYFYNPRSGFNLTSTASSSRSGGPVALNVFNHGLRSTIDNQWEVLFMRAEGLHAHGYQDRASSMAVQLAHQLLRNPPDLIGEMHSAAANHNGGAQNCAGNVGGAKPKNKNKRAKMAMSNQITYKASATLSHCAFLTTVLSEKAAHHNLAFQVGMFGLEMARPPASTKPMEVRLAHQESELVALLKKIPLGPAEMRILRDRAAQLRDGTLKSRGEALLPLMLAAYVFDSLVTGRAEAVASEDESLGFEAAVATIGMKANASEADHPLLCEGSRRQRGELALSLLVHYKDHPDNVARVMVKLLDKDINHAFKSPLDPNYYFTGCGRRRQQQQQQQEQQQQQQHRQDDLNQRLGNLGLHAMPPGAAAEPRNPDVAFDNPPPPPQPFGAAGAIPGNNWDSWESWEREREQRAAVAAAAGQPGGRLGGPSGLRREQMFQQPPGGAPAALRQHPQRAGSDSGSSGNSSADSIVSSSSSSRRNNSVRNNQDGIGHNGNNPLLGRAGDMFLPPAGVPPPSLVSDGLLDHPPPSHQHDRPPPPLGGAAAANALSATAMAAAGGARHM